ncbi:MAG: DUF3147 family protein [Opitutales bacterium]
MAKQQRLLAHTCLPLDAAATHASRMYVFVKYALSALIVVLVSETGKANKLLGAIIASLPLTTYLAMVWIYVDGRRLAKTDGPEVLTKAINDIADLSVEIVWLVLPSLVPFVLLPWMLRKGWNFPLSLLLATVAMVAAYWLTIWGGEALGLRGDAAKAEQTETAQGDGS